MKNIKYNSKTLSDTYSKIRTSWSEFYDSEKTILERVGISFKDSVFSIKKRIDEKSPTEINLELPLLV